MTPLRRLPVTRSQRRDLEQFARHVQLLIVHNTMDVGSVDLVVRHAPPAAGGARRR